MFAIFESIGFSELLLIAIVGILCFGKRLPEVASQAGAQLAKLRRSLQDIKTETGVDHEVRKIQRTFQEAIPHDLSVGEVARLASAKVQERVQATRKELCEEIEKPAAAAEPAAPDPGATPPAASAPSEGTIPRTTSGGEAPPPAA